MTLKDPSYYQQFLVADIGLWRLYVHEQQYYLGRVYFWATMPGPIDLLERSDYELVRLKLVMQATKKVLQQLCAPDRYNYAALANVAESCHVHLIPRYKGIRTWNGQSYVDERWGKNYAPYPKREMPLPDLLALRDALKERVKAELKG